MAIVTGGLAGLALQFVNDAATKVAFYQKSGS